MWIIVYKFNKWNKVKKTNKNGKKWYKMILEQITNNGKVGDGINVNDEYFTPCYAVRPILKYIRPGSTVWCPFDTEESNYVKMIGGEGHKVLSSHISLGYDFFKVAVPYGVDYIISNPPYSLKTKVFHRLFKLGIPFAMLVGVVGLFESQRRFRMFRDNDFEIMYFDKRVSYFRDYADTTPSLNPPFSSVYICSGMLPKQIVFETLTREGTRLDSQYDLFINI